ncbi:MAG: hypothetical protein LBE06_01555 [Azoarcus sp.]|nr:hypothetical protein [Azoarcus sp.]
MPEPALPGLLAVGALIAHALRRRAHR